VLAGRRPYQAKGVVGLQMKPYQAKGVVGLQMKTTDVGWHERPRHTSFKMVDAISAVSNIKSGP
jgi:hypothetical protein